MPSKPPLSRNVSQALKALGHTVRCIEEMRGMAHCTISGHLYNKGYRVYDVVPCVDTPGCCYCNESQMKYPHNRYLGTFKFQRSLHLWPVLSPDDKFAALDEAKKAPNPCICGCRGKSKKYTIP